jgi:flagellin-specific chaperone FliS
MNPYRAYTRSERASGWTRIDLLLAVYDKALGRLDRAEEALRNRNEGEAVFHMAKAQLAVSVLAGGVRAGDGNELGVNMLRLYDFVVRQLTEPKLERIQDARKILTNLRKGFEAIREEANTLERSGRLPSGDQLHLMNARA